MWACAPGTCSACSVHATAGHVDSPLVGKCPTFWCSARARLALSLCLASVSHLIRTYVGVAYLRIEKYRAWSCASLVHPNPIAAVPRALGTGRVEQAGRSPGHGGCPPGNREVIALSRAFSLAPTWRSTA